MDGWRGGRPKSHFPEELEGGKVPLWSHDGPNAIDRKRERGFFKLHSLARVNCKHAFAHLDIPTPREHTYFMSAAPSSDDMRYNKVLRPAHLRAPELVFYLSLVFAPADEASDAGAERRSRSMNGHFFLIVFQKKP